MTERVKSAVEGAQLDLYPEPDLAALVFAPENGGQQGPNQVPKSYRPHRPKILFQGPGSTLPEVSAPRPEQIFAGLSGQLVWGTRTSVRGVGGCPQRCPGCAPDVWKVAPDLFGGSRVWTQTSGEGPRTSGEGP